MSITSERYAVPPEINIQTMDIILNIYIMFEQAENFTRFIFSSLGYLLFSFHSLKIGSLDTKL